MREYQVVGYDRKGSVTHAGITKLNRLGPRIAQRLENDWRRWRDKYVMDNPGDYPLATDAQNPDRKTVLIAAWPVGNRAKVKMYPVT